MWISSKVERSQFFKKHGVVLSGGRVVRVVDKYGMLWISK